MQNVFFTFDNLGQRYQIVPRVKEGWLEIQSILETLNGIIKPVGQQFEVLAGTDDQYFIIRLSAKEKHNLMQLFGLRFK